MKIIDTVKFLLKQILPYLRKNEDLVFLLSLIGIMLLLKLAISFSGLKISFDISLLIFPLPNFSSF